MRTLSTRSGVPIVLVVLAALAVAGTAPAAPARIPAVQRLAVVLTAHEARAHPSAGAAAVGVVDAHRPITGERTVLPVLGRARGPEGVPWLHVRLPGRPNGHTGWIRQSGTRTARTAWALLIDRGRRLVRVYRHGRLAATFSAVVGKPSTPTPSGRFFVEEAFPIIPGYAGGPYAIALSARSDVYRQFDGGPGQIALHGVFGIGGIPGTAVSHGCVRLDSSDMAWLGERIHPGVPVTIVD